MTDTQDLYYRYRYAQVLFDAKRYAPAAKELAALLEQADADVLHGLDEAKLLLARAYYHSAALQLAEQTARDYLADNPSDGYAVLLLARALERQSRHQEAEPLFQRADVLGAIA